MNSTCSVETSPLATPSFALTVFYGLAAIGLPINIFGAYCIFYKTPSRMKRLRLVLLLLNVCTSLLDVSLSFLSAPFIPLPCIMGFPMGIMTVFGIPTSVFTYIVICLAATVGCCNILLLEYRYNTLVRNSTWKILRVPFHIINFTAACTFLLPQYELYMPLDQQKFIAACPYFPCNYPIPNTTFALTESIWYLTGCIICAVTYSVSTGIFFAVKIQIYIKNLKNQSVNLKRMQQKLQTALVLQFIIPLWSLAVPFATVAFIIFFQMHNQIFTNFVFATMSSHGACATVTMLVVHEPYKKFAFQWFYSSKRILSKKILKPQRVGASAGSSHFI